MKAIYKSIFFSVALLFGMASCDNKDELPPTGPRDNAEKLVAGTYVGEWTRETVGTDQVVTGSGSIIFSVDEENYTNNVSVMTVSSSEIDLGVASPVNTVCNITLLSSGVFTYWNQTGSNPLGTTFYGQVDTDGKVTLMFNKIVTANRKDTEYNYTFTGTKQ